MTKASEIKEEKLKQEACKISIKEGSFYSIMEGFGLRYITPYALALGANNTNIGILNSFPALIGSFSELFTVKLMRKFSRKTIVFWGVLLQAVMWLLILGIGSLFFVFKIDHTLSPNALLIAYTLMVLFGAFTVPAWVSWMKDIVPKNFGEFFGVRNRIVGFAVLVSMFVAGYVLDIFKKSNLFLGFSILFVLAFIGRSLSAYLFTKKYEPEYNRNNHYHDGLIHFVKRIGKTNFGKFSLFFSLLSLVVAIASPFFAVYMLNDLGFSYFEFTLVIMSPLIVRLIVFPAWGRFSDIYGNMKVVKINGYLISLIPFLWFASTFIPKEYVLAYLIALEAFAGFIWAGFDLSAGNFIFDAVEKVRIPMAVADYTILANIGTFIGALLGGFISSMKVEIFSLNSMLFVFLLSGILRFAVAAIMLPKIREVRSVKRFNVRELEKAILNITPGRIVRILR